MSKKNVYRLVFTIIVIFLILIVYSAFSIWSFSDKVQLVKTDVAVVLGAAAWDDEPSPVLRERVNHSIWLYENGYVDKIIFTGGKGKGDKFAESEVAREYAINNNVNSEDILIETKSKVTEENLRYAYDIATEKNFETFTIISDPLHMKRAILMAKNTGMEAYSSPTQSSVYKTLNSKIPFFFRELFFYIGYIVSLPFR
ncbi:YdcF family protein [Paenibacillus sp. IHBB 10380]|uniref:YdcF family protein n=1 Tax=Paenibacillus sp. IHBB 10380 TaxID=1566358 RepID=UPI0005CFDCCB|nr:YdcF family protein [Paenibacillus sp. IHBB 10380]AJS58564.1 multidrug MFS transporter [Paenibacillus sp. IHBB 10380]